MLKGSIPKYALEYDISLMLSLSYYSRFSFKQLRHGQNYLHCMVWIVRIIISHQIQILIVNMECIRKIVIDYQMLQC